ncbi:auxilin-like protein [Trifolium pratense]|uniref:Auxilin-like protein n=1 Tax=Trifolium pratense TaxID=57577 RepID=A0A2K3LBH6_TRIPR|nr:auxilin-like protein [Trifolium pratense]
MLRIFFYLISIEGLGQHMSPIEYRTVLKYRLMIPLFPVDEVCPICRKACLNRFGEHPVHCRELPNFKYRHDFVRDVLFDVFTCAGVFVKKKALVNFLTDPLESRGEIYIEVGRCSGVWMGRRKTCMCGLDWSFPTCGIDD